MPAAVIALSGPTGIGKTAVALALADRLRERAEDPLAISADALQVYRGLETLTAAATAEERRRLEHRLQSFVPVERTFSVGEYMALAHREIDEALGAGRRPIVVGGTGLYLRAALSDLELRPPPRPGLRERIERELERGGAPALHARLAARAPGLAEAVPPTDRSRIVRVLELVEMGEDPQPEPEPGRSQLWTAETRHPTLLVGLVMEREPLYERIDRRTERIAAEAGAEVRRAVARGASRTAREAIGFEELLRGDIEAMKRRTRAYARRQLTWMRKMAGVRMVDLTGREPSDAAAEIASLAR
ncbi:MAG TPA: tRNA (adenosine(37)-N6)-dimethylallyltransferase MiaA [Thermoleophilaceae bacterium]|nr:tRNA (adenosine(37)-N6)-dimethylallyltransferase MiaA [Thermoleophilaceae bacterium]